MKNKICIRFLGILIAGTALVTGCGKNDEPVTVYPPDIYYYEDESVSSQSVPVDIGMEQLVYESPADYKADALIYYKGNPQEYNMPAQADIHFDQVSVSFQDGCRIIKLPLTIQMQGRYTEDDIDYSGCMTPSFEFVDKYSGVIFPTEQGHGNGGFAYAGNINYDGNNIKIEYTCDFSCTGTDWKAAENGGFEKDVFFEVLYTISMPDNYDGLALKVTPVRTYNDKPDDGKSHYVNEEFPEGTKLFDIKQN